MTLNWVLIVWTMGASASLTLAAMHLLFCQPTDDVTNLVC